MKARDLIANVACGMDPVRALREATNEAAPSDKRVIPSGTSIEDFWKMFPHGTEEKLLALEDRVGGGRKYKTSLPNIGRVEAWIDECSEGADRGGYVLWIKCLDVFERKTQPLELEQIPEDNALFFAGRMGRL